MHAHLADLWKRIGQGDHPAWQTLVAEFADLVFAVARRAGLDRPDAEDCAQATWLALYRFRHTIRDAQALPAWLIRTTRRRAVLMAKERAGRRTAEWQAPISIAATQQREAELSEFCAHLPLAMKALDPRCRKVLEDLYLTSDPGSYAELARSLGLRADTVGPLRTRCLERLRNILEKMGWELH